MKKRKVHKLLRQAAKDGGIQVDFITGKRLVDLYGSDQYGSVAMSAYRDKKGKLSFIEYTASRDDNTSSFNELRLHCWVDNGRKFLKPFGNELGNLSVDSGNIYAFAKTIDSLPGVDDSDISTHVSLNGGEDSVWV